MSRLAKLAAAAAVCLSTAGAAQAQDLIKVGVFSPPTSTSASRVIQPWIDAVQEDVGDALRIQGFFGGTLGRSPRKQFELVVNGVADVAYVLPQYTGGQFPESDLFQLPFLFNDAREASVVGWKLYEEGLLTGFNGVKLLGVYSTEPAQLFMAEAIDGLSGIDGQKIRASGIGARLVEHYGGSPEALSSTELVEALNRGTLDGAIQAWTGMQTYDGFPLVEQAHRVPLGVIAFFILMNEDKWNGLSEDEQAAFMRHSGIAMAEAGAEAFTKRGEDAYREGVEAGVDVVTPDEAQMARYGEETRGIHEDWIAKTPNGEAIYARIQEILAGMRG